MRPISSQPVGRPSVQWGLQTNSSGQQRTAGPHFLPLTRGPNPAGIFQVPHSSDSQALYESKPKAGAAGHKLKAALLVGLLTDGEAADLEELLGGISPIKPTKRAQTPAVCLISDLHREQKKQENKLG